MRYLPICASSVGMYYVGFIGIVETAHKLYQPLVRTDI